MTEKENNEKTLPFLLAVVGRGGCGKSTIFSDYKNPFMGLKTVETYTTRAERYEHERGHIFVSKKKFDELNSDGIAYRKVGNDEYCTSTMELERSDVFVVDVDGLNDLRSKFTSQPVFVLQFVIDREISIQRMISRGDSPERAEARAAADDWMLEDFIDYDFMVDATLPVDEVKKRVSEGIDGILNRYFKGHFILHPHSQTLEFLRIDKQNIIHSSTMPLSRAIDLAAAAMYVRPDFEKIWQVYAEEVRHICPTSDQNAYYAVFDVMRNPYNMFSCPLENLHMMPRTIMAIQKYADFFNETDDIFRDLSCVMLRECAPYRDVVINLNKQHISYDFGSNHYEKTGCANIIKCIEKIIKTYERKEK